MTARRPGIHSHSRASIVLTAWLDAAVSPFAATRSLIVALIVAAALAAIASLPLRSIQAGAIVASAVIGVLWSKQLLTTMVELGSRMGPLAIVWGLLIVVAIVLVVRAVRRSASRISVDSVTVFLNRASLLLVVAAVVVRIGERAACCHHLGPRSGSGARRLAGR